MLCYFIPNHIYEKLTRDGDFSIDNMDKLSTLEKLKLSSINIYMSGITKLYISHILFEPDDAVYDSELAKKFIMDLDVEGKDKQQYSFVLSEKDESPLLVIIMHGSFWKLLYDKSRKYYNKFLRDIVAISMRNNISINGIGEGMLKQYLGSAISQKGQAL